MNRSIKMKKTRLSLGVLTLVLALGSFSCAKKQEPKPTVVAETNPFFTEWTAPFGTPPFPEIKEAHYMPAFQEGMGRQKKEVEAIATSAKAPTFANTIEALERTGELLTRVNNVFYALTDNHTNDELQKIEAEVAPILAKHDDDIALNDRLFRRVEAVWKEKDKQSLTPEQARLLELK